MDSNDILVVVGTENFDYAFVDVHTFIMCTITTKAVVSEIISEVWTVVAKEICTTSVAIMDVNAFNPGPKPSYVQDVVIVSLFLDTDLFYVIYDTFHNHG